MLTRDEVLQTLERERASLRGLGVRRLGLFGSFARGSPHPESDLDFVVDFQPRTFDRYMDLKLLLERLFGRPVDLVLADAIKPRLRPAILGEAVYAQGL